MEIARLPRGAQKDRFSDYQKCAFFSSSPYCRDRTAFDALGIAAR